MNNDALIVFNLLANGVLEFLFTVVIVCVLLKVARLEDLRVRVFLLFLPCIKLAAHLIQGVPSNSFLFSGATLAQIPPKGGNLSASALAGLEGASFLFGFSMRNVPHQGDYYVLSLADMLSLWARDHVSPYLPLAVVTLLLLVSAILFARDIKTFVGFEKDRRTRRRLSSEALAPFKVDFRWVDVYVDQSEHGTPYTGGFFRPYICFPASSYDALNAEERAAVLAHEMGHIRYFDAVTATLTRALGNLFWFVPFYKRWIRRIDEERELLADFHGSRHGELSLHLASALVKLESKGFASTAPCFQPQLFGAKKFLTSRVERLLAQTSAPQRARALRAVFKLAFVWFVLLFVINSSFCGNWMRAPTDSDAPAWLKKAFGKYSFLLRD